MRLASTRWTIAPAVAVVLAVLTLWHGQRMRLLEACSARGGLWNGTTSKCIPIPGPPVLQRDLRRT